MALRAKHVGEFGPHAAAKRAGFKKGDVVIAFGGDQSRMSEGDLMRIGVQRFKVGENIPVTVRRGNETVELSIPMQP
jgi:S1-C subfamily serine protease